MTSWYGNVIVDTKIRQLQKLLTTILFCFITPQPGQQQRKTETFLFSRYSKTIYDKTSISEKYTNMMTPHKGINYDTGFEPYGPANSSRKTFDIEVVRREMQIIAFDLHCTHIRITGADPDRIAIAARQAVEAGMIVWFSPFPCNLSPHELVSYFVNCARKAEEIHKISAGAVFVLGCELSLFNSGFLPGSHLLERSQAFAEFDKWQPAMNKTLKEFFAKAVPEIRQYFHGNITYAAGEWEDIDWSFFDIVSVDLYRAKHNLAYYELQLKNYMVHNKPVAITEFGCCALYGAAKLGGNATFTVLSIQGDILVVNEGWQYSEEEQVNYLKELFSIFTATGVRVAFWFTFADYEKLYSDDKSHNLDMASYGVVQMLGQSGKTYPGMQWEPRKVFWEISQV